MTLKSIFVSLTVLVVVGPAERAVSQVICDDEKIAFVLTSPAEWDLDTASGKNQGLCIVGYPHGSSWKESSAAIYAHAVDQKTNGNDSLGEFIASDVRTFQAHSSDLKVSSEPDLQTSNHRRVAMRFFSGDPYGNREAVAYVDEIDVFVVLVLTAKNNADYDHALPVFRQVVKSYNLLGRPLSAGEMINLAKEEEKLPESSAYEAVMIKLLGPKFASTLRTCTASLKQLADPFDIAYRIANDGSMIVLVNPETAVANCLKLQVEKELVPSPPYSPFHRHDTMKFTQ